MSSPVSDAEALLLSLLDKEREIAENASANHIEQAQRAAAAEKRVEALEKTLREIAEIAERFSLTSGTRPRFDVADMAKEALS